MRRGAKVVDPTLLLYWPLNEGSGTIAHDKSKYGDDGTITGATWQGNYLLFNGPNQLVSLNPTSPLKDRMYAFSILYWIKPSVVKYYPCIFKGTLGYTGSFGIWADNYMHVFLYRSEGGISFWFQNDPILNEWNLYTYTWDGTTIRLYKDNFADRSFSAPGTLPASVHNLIRIGAPYSGVNSYVRKVRFYNRALQLNEIQTIYAKGP